MPGVHLKIPRQFKLMGHTIKVRFVQLDRKTDGEWRSDSKLIALSTRLHKKPRSYKEQVFLHEFFHCVLDHMGQTKLSNNEDFVDSMASAFHQALGGLLGGKR